MNATEDTRPVVSSTSDDPRVVRALEEYAAAVEAGRAPDRREFQARHPEIAAALAECLEGLEFVQAAAMQLAHPAAGRSAKPTAPAELWPADALGDYRIVREVGRGGMGVVYEAVQISLGRQVALKVLPFAAALDARQLQRFKNEAQSAAQLHHQNIVPVYGVGCERGVHYYAMQFIDGQTLAAVISELRVGAGLSRREPLAETIELAALAEEFASGRWAVERNSFRVNPESRRLSDSEQDEFRSTAETPLGQTAVSVTATGRSTTSRELFRTVANLGVQAAEALEHAHDLGVAHRDVKPANLLLDTRGNLWVTDFGLAQCQSQAGLTMTGDLLGTLRYMSPEQALGKRSLLDHRTDIYSLGATLYELLTLEPVFDGQERQELLRQIVTEEPRRPRARNAAIPIELETIVLKALEKEPNERYATSQNLADDLSRYLEDEPIRAKPPTLALKMKKWTRRHRGVVRTAMAMSALLLVAVTVVSSVAAWRLNGERDATRGQLRLTQQAEAEGNHRLYRSLVEQARANRLTRRMGQRFKTLDVLTQAATQARELRLPESDLLELRNEAIACLVLPDLTVKKEWEGWPTGSMTMDFDDGLTRYARVDRQGAVSVRRVDNDAEICRLSAYGPGDYGPGEETWPCFTQDGQFLLLQRGEQVKVWELAGSDPRVSVELAGVAATAFSPSGRQLAVGGIDGSIVLYDLATGAVAKPVAAGPRAFGMAFHPHDQRLAASCASEVKIYDLESGSLVRSLFDSAGAFPVAWHPDGNILAGVVGRTVTFWDVATGKPVVQLRGHKSAGVNLAFDHAGDLLGTACWDGILRLWDVHTGQLLFNTHAGAYPLRFSPDDRLLGTGASGQTLRFWQVELGCGHRTLAPHRGFEQREYQACAVSPKHPILAAGTPDGLGLWHLTSGAPLVFIPSPGHRHVVFEPSGALVTNGPSELLRWPIREDPAAPDLLRIGPPQTLPLPGSWMQIANSRDGRVLASGQGDGGGLVWRQSLPGPPLPLLPHEDVRSIGVSPDGRWVATGSHWGTKVKIWDAYNGRLSRELPVEGGSRVEFSPDGKWLATTGGGCRLWSVDTWQPGPNLGGNAAMAFSRDTSLLALDLGYGAIRLVDPATGREYARLEDPNQDAAFWLCFSADGARLVSTTSPSRSIHVWDLRAIRAELAQMGLDWDLPPYSPALPDEERPLRIELTPATE